LRCYFPFEVAYLRRISSRGIPGGVWGTRRRVELALENCIVEHDRELDDGQSGLIAVSGVSEQFSRLINDDLMLEYLMNQQLTDCPIKFLLKLYTSGAHD
jgi:hypothetical protein